MKLLLLFLLPIHVLSYIHLINYKGYCHQIVSIDNVLYRDSASDLPQNIWAFYSKSKNHNVSIKANCETIFEHQIFIDYTLLIPKTLLNDRESCSNNYKVLDNIIFHLKRKSHVFFTSRMKGNCLVVLDLEQNYETNDVFELQLNKGIHSLELKCLGCYSNKPTTKNGFFESRFLGLWYKFKEEQNNYFVQEKNKTFSPHHENFLLYML